ncbi:MAG: DUF1186 domain-containing protein, partial [Muribaculaceae bacterium]|nr:DUF1186 domain-containing protein [Muribaculaceae bacterium]
HAVILLTGLANEKGLPGLLEILRQSEEFIEFHFGDLGEEMIPKAISACLTDNPAAIESFLSEPGLDSLNRAMGSEGLAITAIIEPEKRPEIIEIFRRLLGSMKERLPKTNGCDATFAGFVISHLIDMEAKELVEEVRSVFSTDCVDKSIAGDCEEAVDQIEHNLAPRHYEIPTIQEQYEYVKSFG